MLQQVPGAAQGTAIDPSCNGLFGLLLPNIGISPIGIKFAEFCKESYTKVPKNFGMTNNPIVQQTRQQLQIPKNISLYSSLGMIED